MKSVPNISLALAIFAFLASSSFAARAIAAETVLYQPGITVPGKQWEVVDIGFQCKELSKQPTDIEFSAAFTNDAGKEVVVNGFFNGGNQYLLRFTPQTTGKFRC